MEKMEITMSKKKTGKKIKRKFLKLLMSFRDQVKQIPPKYWNKHF
jgi:hypothetical protein